jgi:ribosomal protein S18 acetylase RimI-like enzyme
MIRPGAPLDLDQLEPLARRFREEVDGGDVVPVDRWRRWMLQRLTAGDVRVIVVDRVVVGYIVWRLRTRLEILELYVRPDERGQRMGSGLLARAIDAARQHGAEEIALLVGVDDPIVQGIFGALGFRVEDRALVRSLRLRGVTGSVEG